MHIWLDVYAMSAMQRQQTVCIHGFTVLQLSQIFLRKLLTSICGPPLPHTDIACLLTSIDTVGL